MPTKTSSPFFRYGVVAASLVAATLVRLLVDPILGNQIPFSTFFVAVLVTAWYGGFGPSLLTLFLGGITAAYLFIQPRGTLLLPELHDRIGLGIFFVVGLTTALFSEALHRARRRAEASAEEADRHREALAVSEARYRQIVETADEGIWMIDADNRTTFVNRRMAEILGCVPDEMLGRSAFDFVFPEDRAQGEQLVAQRRKGVREGLDLRYRRQDSNEVWLHVSASPVLDEQDRYAGSVGLFTDITRRRRTEQELQQQKEWFKVTLASIGDAVIVTDTAGKVTFLNAMAQNLTGLTDKAGEGQSLESVFKIVNEYTREPVESPVVRALREGVASSASQTVLIDAAGTRRPIDGSAAPIKNEQGHVVGVVLIFRDATERRRADEAQRRLAAIVESSDDAIIGKNLDGIITSWNRGAERVYGYPAVEVVGKAFSLLVPSDRADEVQDSVRRLQSGEHLDHFETVRRRKDGKLIDVSISYSPIKDAEGHVVGTAVITRDVTERKQAEKALRQRERQLQLVTDNAPVLIAHCDTQRLFKFVNRPYAARFGLHPRDVVGKSIAEVLGPEASAVIAPYVDAVLAGRRIEFEAEIPYRELGTQHMLCAYEPELDGDRVVGYVAAITNISERKRIERALSEEARTTETLYRVGKMLAAELDLQKLVQTVTDEIMALIEAQFGAFFYNVFNERGESYTLYTLSGVSRDAFARFPMPRNTAVFAPTFRGEGVVRLDDVTEDPRYGNNTPYHGMPEAHLPVKSYLAVPVVSRSGEVLGGLFFGHSQVGRFSERHESLAVGIAAQAAVAIDNARLYGQVRESEERLRLALETGRMGVWDWNLATNEIKWSDNLEAVHGLAPGSFGGTLEAFQQLIHPEDREVVNRAITRAVEAQGSYDLEFRNLRPDGSVRWMIGKGQVFAVEGRPTRLIGVGMDITDRKRSEQDTRFLADASATLAGLVDYESTLQKVARLAVPTFADWCTVDMLTDGRSLRRVAVAHVDPTKVELAHDLHRRYPPDPNAAQGVWNIIRSGKSELIPAISDELLAAGAPDAELLRILRDLGLKSYLGVPLTVRGKVMGVISFIAAESGRRYDEADLAVAEDLAYRAGVAVENARLYQEVREADRRKEDFLSLLAHELRNPLAPIRNGLQILKLTGGNGEAVGPAVEMMERQVHHLVRLVDDLLDVSRIMRNKIELRREPIELATVVARAVETSQPVIDAERHQLSVALPPEPLWIHGDLVRLAQVVSNLLNNAARYTEPGGSIRVEGSRQGDLVILRVRDTGIGLAPETLLKIWDMFVQVDRSTKGAQGGLGIGLTLVRSLVEMHGGIVGVRSEGLGKGSEFVVSLPLLERSGNETLIGQPQPARGRARRILVVDDGIDAAESLAMLLRLEGHEVSVAHNGASALQLAEADPPEVAFLDIGMPGMDGYELARRFRALPALRGVVLIALTGWGQEEDRRRTREAGFDHHLVKPVEPETLNKLLSERSHRG